MSTPHRLTGSLLFRLAVGYALVAAVFTAAWVWSLYGPLAEAALTQQQRNLTAVAQSAALLASESNDSPARMAQGLVARTDLRLTIIASDGSVLADSNTDASAMESPTDRPEVREALAGRIGTDHRVSPTEGQEELHVAVPGSIDGRRVVVRVSQPMSEIEDIASRSRRIALVLLGIAMAITFAVAVSASRAAARPVRELSAVAGKMAAGDLSVEIPEMPADLSELADALATLRSQVQSRLEALEQERHTLRTALDGLGDAVLLMNGETVLLANREASRMFRTPSRGWAGSSLDETGLPAPVLEATRERLGSDHATALDLPPDPTGRHFRVYAAPLPFAPDVASGVIVVISDITERARVELVRRDFVANASHELKTPVAGIRLLAETAATAAEDGETDRALAFTRLIEAETDRLQKLVSDLLDLSRLDSSPKPDAIADVRMAVERAVVSHKAASARKGLALASSLDAVRGQDVFVHADPTDLAIALDNLLDNAIAYTDTGTVSVTVMGLDGSVLIKVGDTGPGIPAEHQPRVFERFYRVDRSRSRDAGGTGLGLALVRHVAERSGGSVTLESLPGTGSTFTLNLPRAT
ncbi:MAG: ATP-binding protein [Coriobacteriia bacterium]|nr:ATP-binding protein [Coriobacteriia bacterium]